MTRKLGDKVEKMKRYKFCVTCQYDNGHIKGRGIDVHLPYGPSCQHQHGQKTVSTSVINEEFSKLKSSSSPVRGDSC